LQDHPVVGIVYRSLKACTLDQADTLLSRLKFLFAGRGPLTSNVGEAGAFVKTEPGLTAPDLQLYFGPAYFINHGFERPSGCGFTLAACLPHPSSRGYVALRSADPLAHPVIQPEYLADDSDLRGLTEGVRRVRDVAQSAAFDPYRGEEYLPGE